MVSQDDGDDTAAHDSEDSSDNFDEHEEDPARRLEAMSHEDVDAAFAGIAAELRPTDLSPSAIQPGPEGSDHGGPRDFALANEPDEGFTPPDPGPIGGGDPFLTAGWILVVGGLLTMLVTVALWSGVPRIFLAGCAIATVIGGALLTWRMPQHRRDDDDDLGAVV